LCFTGCGAAIDRRPHSVLAIVGEEAALLGGLISGRMKNTLDEICEQSEISTS
jgi:hypothetical protein